MICIFAFRCLSGLVEQFIEDNRCEASKNSFKYRSNSLVKTCIRFILKLYFYFNRFTRQCCQSEKEKMAGLICSVLAEFVVLMMANSSRRWYVDDIVSPSPSSKEIRPPRT